MMTQEPNYKAIVEELQNIMDSYLGPVKFAPDYIRAIIAKHTPKPGTLEDVLRKLLEELRPDPHSNSFARWVGLWNQCDKLLKEREPKNEG